MFTRSSLTNSTIKAFKDRFADKVLLDEPLAPYLAYKIGGPADILIFPDSLEDLETISALSKQFSLPIHILGSGTNLLVSDDGLRGISLILSKGFKEIEIIKKTPEETILRVGGGVDKQNLLSWCVERGLSGLEFSSGVPGTLGGGIFMNAGTKYGCYADRICNLALYDFYQGLRWINTSGKEFSYRHQTLVTKETLVLWVELRLHPGDPGFLKDEVNRIIEERKAKQPLDFPSCGSTFKNPEGFSAGRLIEKAGLKGLQVGGAEISEKHANFFLNKNHATANDIKTLIQIAQKKVWEAFGVTLECEVIFMGDEAPCKPEPEN